MDKAASEGEGNTPPLWGGEIFHSLPKIFLFALSTAEVSRVARYMRVVRSDSCPSPSLIVEMETFLDLAILAHE